MAVSKKKKIIKKKIVSKKVTKKVTNKKAAKKVIKKITKKKIIVKKVKNIKKKERGIKLLRSTSNPIMKPGPYSWESRAVLNPAVLSVGGRVHLFYRALGDDGISRIGYASSGDGIHFHDRLTYPVFFVNDAEDIKSHWPFTSPARPEYNTSLYSSGGGWGGCEDPRAVKIDGRIYLTFNMFNGWESMRVAFTSIDEKDLINKKWNWDRFAYLTRPGDRQKNWVLFPEKINGKFAIFHNLDKGDPKRVHIAYVDELDMHKTPSMKEAPDPQVLPDHVVAWHKRTRSASAPPIKTKDGWLLLYHAMDKDLSKYKLGALLLDLKDPEKVLYRSREPILEPDAWYENDWKPGIIYASGAIVNNGRLFVYYGGGDKYIGVASIMLSDLIDNMKNNKPVKLKKDSALSFE